MLDKIMQQIRASFQNDFKEEPQTIQTTIKHRCRNLMRRKVQQGSVRRPTLAPGVLQIKDSSGKGTNNPKNVNDP